MNYLEFSTSKRNGPTGPAASQSPKGTRSVEETKMTTKQINPGDTIITTYGNRYTVESVYDNMIYVYESQNVIHISNVVEVTR